jgi:hypothetical protein
LKIIIENNAESIPSEKCSLKKTEKNAFQKSGCPFFKKKKRSKKCRMRSKMERSRTRSCRLRTLFFLKKRVFTFLERVSCLSYREQRRTYSTSSWMFSSTKKYIFNILERVLARSYIKWWIMVSIFLGKCSYKGNIENDKMFFRWLSSLCRIYWDWTESRMNCSFWSSFPNYTFFTKC